MAISRLEQFVSLDMKGCICHFVNWQIHPFIFKMTLFWQLHMWNIHNPGFLNPLTAKLFNQTFHPLEVVSRWRDPQLQVSKNYSDLTKWRLTILKSCWLISHFISNMFKRWYVKCKKKPRTYSWPAIEGLNYFTLYFVHLMPIRRWLNAGPTSEMLAITDGVSFWSDLFSGEMGSDGPLSAVLSIFSFSFVVVKKLVFFHL